MKAKKRRKLVWCEPTEVSAPQSVAIRFPNLAQCNQPKPDLKRPSYCRCPECGRRLKLRFKECHDVGCWHAYLPPHKKAIKV